MNNKEKYKQAFSTLHASEHISLEDAMNKKRSYKPTRKIAAAAACPVLLLGSSTAYAAYHYLNSSQIADEVAENGALSEAFAGEDAITVNETQSSNGYDITLLGLVSGEKLELYVPNETKKEVSEAHTYVDVAISKTDGTKMKYRNFCVSPLICGESFSDVNAATLDVGLTWFEKDGIIYELIECDNLEIFADRGVYLSVVDNFGAEAAAFQMDETTGTYSKVENYAGTSALFTLQLDEKKADAAAAEEYLSALRQTEESETAEGEMASVTVATGEASEEALGYITKKAQEFVSGITEENLEDYFELEEDYPVFTATPDENGWIDFGAEYMENEGWTVDGGRGYLSNWIAEDQDFNVTSMAVSGTDEEEGDMSTLQIGVVFRNEDGSVTEATYRIREDKVSCLEE